MKNPLKTNKGEGLVDFAVAGVLGFIVVAVILYVGIPILGGVQSATLPTTNYTRLGELWGSQALANAQGNTSASIASGANLTGIVEIVIPAVIILGVLMIGLVRRK